MNRRRPTNTYQALREQPIGQRPTLACLIQWHILSGRHQWYFFNQDTRSRNWAATQPVPQSLNLGREAIHHSTVPAADVDDIEARHTQSPLPQDRQHYNSAMTTQTITGTSIVAAALMLAGTSTRTTRPIFRGFGSGSKPIGTSLLSLTVVRKKYIH